MKKLFSILALAMIIGLFSSCIIVATAEEEPSPPTYSITFCNDYDDDVIDWYVKNDDGKRFAKSENFVVVRCDDTSKLKGLRKDYYKVLFAFIPNDYYETTYIYLNENVDFILRKKNDWSFDSRSAVNTNSSGTEYVLVDSNGNEYPLIKSSE